MRSAQKQARLAELDAMLRSDGVDVDAVAKAWGVQPDWVRQHMAILRLSGAKIKAKYIGPGKRRYVKDPKVLSLDISRDSTYVAVGGEGAFGICRLTTGEQILAVAAVNKSFDVRFHPSDPKLYVATSDSIQVWLQDGEQFIQKSTTPVQLNDRNYVFADDAPILSVVEIEKRSLTLYRLPDQ